MNKSPIAILLVVFLSINLGAQTGGETCDDATVITSIPAVLQGTTVGTNDDYFASCPDVGNPGGAPDVVYVYTTGDEDVFLDFDLCLAVTDYDSQLYIFEGSCTGDNVVGCQEDGCQSPEYGAPFNSRITAQFLQANTDYYIVLDGYSSDSEGEYQLNISESIGLEIPQQTNLPLVLIDTDGEEIPDEPKITANLKIIDNGPDELNHPTDPANVYDGFMGIEIRGSFSASLPQKPFGLETRDALGENNNVSLLGMPQENDWILLANYNDKTFFRNVLAFDLFTKMGHYAPRTRIVEVGINDIYQGIYVFTEKIKRDNGRIDIPKLDFDDNAGDSLTGGYIFKVDYWSGSDSWSSDYENPNYPGNEVRYVQDYPDVEDITSEQEEYIQSLVQSFEDALWSDDFMTEQNGYRQYIDMTSFIDYFLVNELGRNWDGFKKSRYFHKDKDSDDPKIHAGPVWDFDWAFKDISEDYENGEGWLHNFSGGTDVTPPGWYVRMMQDSVFTNALYCRYTDLRSNVMSNESIVSFIDSMAVIVNDAQERHYVRWPILGVGAGGPDIQEQPENFAGEMIKLKDWIEERLIWLDANMPGNCVPVGIDETDRIIYSSVYPNPSKGAVNFYAEKGILKIEIYDSVGRLLNTHLTHRENLVQQDLSELSGIYLVIIHLENGQVAQHKIHIKN